MTNDSVTTRDSAMTDDRAWKAACTVTDPELPMLTLQDLGVLRHVETSADGVIVWITPTYSGCPAMATMRDDLRYVLQQAGFADVEVRVQLSPPWSSDDMTARGKRRLAEAGISPPGTRERRETAVTLTLQATRRVLACPRCGSQQTQIITEFGATPCKALYRCDDCRESFEHFKEI